MSIRLGQKLKRGFTILEMLIATGLFGVASASVRTSASIVAIRGWIMPTPFATPLTVTEVVRPRGVVPHVLPGANDMIKDFTNRLKIPSETIWAGAETMYPEFKSKLRSTR